MNMERLYPTGAWQEAEIWQEGPPCSVPPGNLSHTHTHTHTHTLTHMMEYYIAMKNDKKMCMYLFIWKNLCNMLYNMLILLYTVM